jgi:hypothetical protein
MTEEEQTEATLIVEMLIVQRANISMIAKKLNKDFSISRKQTKNLISNVYEQWEKEEKTVRCHSRLQQLKFLSHLTIRCLSSKKMKDKDKIIECRKIEELRAKIEGTFAPTQLQISDDVHDDNTDERSEEEYNFYAENGYFPEENDGRVVH